MARNSVLSIDNKLLIYKTMLRPILSYACPVWTYSCKSLRRQLQAAQNGILRMICNDPWYIRNSQIRKELRIEDLCDFYCRLSRALYDKQELLDNPVVVNYCYDTRDP
ncbi:putative RNA-directed DNA polymerase from transposon X-element, partial [Stegodyphus mimosarum]